MFGSMGQTNVKNLGNGGTMDGDVTITGDLTVSGGIALSLNEVLQGTSTIDINSTEALLVRKNSDGGDVFIVDTTNTRVGVGNTPEVNFHIKLADTANARIEDTSSDGIAKLDFKNDVRQATIGVYGDDSDNFKIDHGGGAVLIINTAQNVGIGTASPVAKMDIVGTRTLNLTNTISDDTDKNAVITHSHYNSGTETEGFLMMQGFSNSSLNRIDLGGGNSQHNAVEEIRFFTAANATTATGTERMAIDNSGDLQLQERLTFSGTNDTTATATINLHSNNYLYVTGGTTGLALTAEGGSDAIKITDGGGTGAISFEVGNTQRFKLDSNSRISLGNNDSSGATSNTIFGRLAGNAIASGAIDNVLIGNESGNDITTGDYNVAIGSNALEKEDVGRGSIAIGAVALGLQNTASEGSANNIGIGLNAGVYNVTGINNTLVGTNVAVGASGQSHSYNTAFGSSALNSVTTGGSNVAMGYNALEGSLTGTQNVSVGTSASQGLTTGLANVSMGFQTMFTPTTVQYSVAVGSESMRNIQAGQALTGVTAVGYASFRGGSSTTTGANYTTAVGHQALLDLQTGGSNTAVGALCAESITTGAENTAIGAGAMRESTTGSDNVAVGREAMGLGITTGNDNVAIGKGAGYDITSATNNTIIGRAAGANLTDNADNVVVGYEAFFTANSGENENVVIGKHAGYYIDNASADENVIIGKGAGQGGSGDLSGCIAIGANALDATGSNDHTGTIAIGHQALTALTSGASNVAVGYQSADEITTGSQNTVVGYGAMHNADSDESDNTCVGYLAGDDLDTGDKCVVIGSLADAKASGQNQTVIGYNAQAGSLADNSVILGNADVTAVYMAQDSGAIVHTAGIQFPASQVANGGANVLDDYEEGDHTATIVGSTSGNYVVNSTNDILRYTKIGRLVNIQGLLLIDSDNSASGTLRISLPFTIGDGTGLGGRSYGSAYLDSHGGTIAGQVNTKLVEGDAYFILVEVADNGTPTDVNDSQVDGAFNLGVNFSYTV